MRRRSSSWARIKEAASTRVVFPALRSSSTMAPSSRIGIERPVRKTWSASTPISWFWPANSPWDTLSSEAIAGGWRARFRLRRLVLGAAVDKTLTLRDGHPFLYQEHVLAGGIGEIPVAHHAMTAMRAGGRLSFSPKRLAMTPEAALEPDPSRGRHMLRYPARSADLHAFPTAVRVGKMITNVTKIRGAQKRVAQRVNEHVRIRVANGPFRRSFKLYSSKKKIAARLELMHIKTHPNPYLHVIVSIVVKVPVVGRRYG